MKNAFWLLAVVLLISGCSVESSKVESNKPPDQNIKFEVNSFNLEYEKESNESGFFEERYNGNGVITVVGNESLVKKPYLVLLNVKKKSGGSKTGRSEYTENVIVINGVGNFKTADWNFFKNEKLTKPEYEFKIIGYIPYIEQK